jgi:Ca2+/Na+ antiporter
MNEPTHRAHRTELRWLYFVLIVALIFFILPFSSWRSALNIVAQVFFMLCIIVGTFRAMQLRNEVDTEPKGEIATPQGKFSLFNLLVTGLFALGLIFYFLDKVVNSGGMDFL